MQRVKLSDSLALRLSKNQRTAIERLAEEREVSLAEAARIFLNYGIAGIVI